MSSGQPLVAADVPPTPSTVASPLPAPEAEVQAEKKATIRIKPSLHAHYASSRLNKFGTTDKTCTTPGCDWVVEEPWLSGLCVVCEQKQHSNLEKERIQSILRKRAKDESVVSLHFATPFFLPLAHIHPRNAEASCSVHFCTFFCVRLHVLRVTALTLYHPTAISLRSVFASCYPSLCCRPSPAHHLHYMRTQDALCKSDSCTSRDLDLPICVTQSSSAEWSAYRSAPTHHSHKAQAESHCWSYRPSSHHQVTCKGCEQWEDTVGRYPDVCRG